MRAKTVLLLTLIVLLPIAALAVGAVRLVQYEQQLVQQRQVELMEGRLAEINRGIARIFDRLATDMTKLTSIDSIDTDELREIVRATPQVLQIFVLSPEGKLIYPDPTQQLTRNEQRFLLSAGKMFVDLDLRSAVRQELGSAESSPQIANDSRLWGQNLDAMVAPSTETKSGRGSATNVHGWFVWYWDRGLHLIYWQRQASGRIVGAALERSRWLADLVAELPETPSAASSQSGESELRIRILGDAVEPLYQWGAFEPSENSNPIAEIHVTQPLQAWRLQCFAPDDHLRSLSRSLWWGLLSGLAALTLAVVSMAWLLYRDYIRSIREAEQQVSFVNQVSHELKTPLTNICLYADLLERDFVPFSEEESDKPLSRLRVIQSESQRLTRLIGNVLTLAQKTKRTLAPRTQSLVPDELVVSIVERFRPSLTASNIAIELELDAAQAMNIDSDFVEQIIGNLISNVEKYAARGQLLFLSTQHSETQLEIVVRDAGPGIPMARRAELFRPFHRLSNNVSAVAGTGIGLSIARDLARLHGGDVELVPSEIGCCFKVTVSTFIGAKPEP